MNQRSFIRHPAGIPIDAQLIDQNEVDHTTMVNLSAGGLAFESPILMPVGSLVSIRVPAMKIPDHVTGKVVWCDKGQSSYLIGVAFTDKDVSFRVRMVEQICHIQSYWRRLRADGRDITLEAAAREWIKKFAGEFPGESDTSH